MSNTYYRNITVLELKELLDQYNDNDELILEHPEFVDMENDTIVFQDQDIVMVVLPEEKTEKNKLVLLK